ncbi:cyclic nucleotide-binding/CBS domain-containing protein [Haloarcula sp. JP-L23]|uniref:CBS domain-containing protein n=1 Tax=Haloarcula sp. JP-L23 TaxID=2716717 RepID=UPI00140EC242|nr:CBS domain-containing protein [Haloarcula sp. JP-L23]
MTVKDICRPKEELVSAGEDTSVRELCQLMDTRRVGCVVIEADDKPTGIVTDRDIAMAFGEGESLDEWTAGDIMNRDPFTTEAGDGVFNLCAKMAEHGIRRVPVIEDGELCGIVTLDDLVVLLEDEMHNISEVIRSESPPYQTP